MPSTRFFLAGTLLLCLNFVRPFGFAVSDWLYMCSLLLAILETITIDRRNASCWTGNRLLPFAFLILLGGLVSLFRSRLPSVAIMELAQILYVMSVFISLIWIMVRRGLREKVISAFILSGVFAASIAVLEFLSGSQLGNQLSGTVGVSYWGRYAGPLGHPNKLGYFLVLTATLTMARWIGARGSNLLVYGIALLVQLSAIYLSGSVTAYFGIAASLAVTLLVSRRARRRLLKWAIPILVLLLVVSAIPWTTGVSPLESLRNGIMDDIDRVRNSTALLRMDIYRLAISRVGENVFVGVGYDQLATSGLTSRARLLPGSVHNTLLEFQYSGGLLAFLGIAGLYAYLAYAAIRGLESGRRNAPMLAGLAASVLALIVMNQFQDAVYQREQWLTVGLFLGTWWSTSEAQSCRRSRVHTQSRESPSADAGVFAHHEQRAGASSTATSRG